jgi:hypothetical protein
VDPNFNCGASLFVHAVPHCMAFRKTGPKAPEIPDEAEDAAIQKLPRRVIEPEPGLDGDLAGGRRFPSGRQRYPLVTEKVVYTARIPSFPGPDAG